MTESYSYTNNPVIHKNRNLEQHVSVWVQQFQCDTLKPLIICRGPVRKEVMDIFHELNIQHYGILLSEKDSIVYHQALAPELRQLTDPLRVHRVPDYSGADKNERAQRIQQIIRIAEENGYNSIFAGYGFMAEDESLVSAIEKANLRFIGPCSRTVRQAGQKDEAKRTAMHADVSVTPGIDDLTQLALLRKCPNLSALQALAKSSDLQICEDQWSKADINCLAGDVLNLSYEKGIDIVTVEEVAEEAKIRVANFWERYPKNRIRLKAIGGGGGKGQRILAAPSNYSGSEAERVQVAASKAPAMIREILQEVKMNGVGDNKNVLIELNIETTRHQEIQVAGNGEWCITLGARDCSMQMHEQKLVEVSQTQEELSAAIECLKEPHQAEEKVSLETDLAILKKMELEAAKFGTAVGLDSVSTFECIVDQDQHFFMEMNTRIQVEHRVTELVYKLRFHNPDDPTDFFEVDSLVELMCLLAAHSSKLPKPTRIMRFPASVEVRLNATNASLRPHAGGQIQFWSDPVEGEVRDDQGICMKNPDTGEFMPYTLAGAYDSNIALLLTYGDHRQATYEKLIEVLRRTRLNGDNLQTNLTFHYGIVSWLLSEHVRAKVTTQFVVPYLTLVGLLKQEANELNLELAYQQIKKRLGTQVSDDIKPSLEAVFAQKRSLLLRPVEMLLQDPHLFSGWLSITKSHIKFVDGQPQWLTNPVIVLFETYHYLNMDYRIDIPAAQCIWKHDNEILQSAMAFYERLNRDFNNPSFQALENILFSEQVPDKWDVKLWEEVRAAHSGFQAGMEVFNILLLIAQRVCFYELKVLPDLTPVIPERLLDAALQDAMVKVLVPPPATKANEVVAQCGGMFYAQESPDRPPFVQEGDHFEKGDPLYMIEVMKMFNKVYAPFSGTIDNTLIENKMGQIVREGQPIFKVTPDEILKEEDPLEKQQRIEKNTLGLVMQALRT